jgi:hypothetical protein
LGLSFLMVFGFYVWHGFLILLEDIYDSILLLYFYKDSMCYKEYKINKDSKVTKEERSTSIHILQGLFSYK